MAALVPWLVTALIVAAILGALTWLAARVRRTGAGRDLMGPIDEIYRPHTHLIQREIQLQEQRAVGLPSADDQPRRPSDSGGGRERL